MKTEKNRHPADELADVRAQITALKDREQELRSSLIEGYAVAGNPALVGDEFVASIRVQKSDRLDSAAVRREFGVKVLRPFMVPSEMTIIKLAERTNG